MTTTVVIADDLTGATDCQTQLTRGTSSRTRLLTPCTTVETIATDLTETDVLVLDIESRFLAPEAARLAYEHALDLALAASHSIRIYLKVDSTLRGSIGEALVAAAERLQTTFVPVVLANPTEGRVTLGGRQFVHGVPLEFSSFARDPAHPVSDSRISTLISAGRPNAKARHILLHEFRAGSAPLAADEPFPGSEFVVFDAVTDADLAQIAVLLDDINPRLVCGSSAFLRYVGVVSSQTDPPNDPAFPSARRILCVCGSLNPFATAQVANLEFAWGIEAVSASDRSDIGADARTLASQLDRTGSAILCTDREGTGADPAALAVKIADTVRLADRGGVDTLIIVGGHTAFYVCSTLGIEALDFSHELSPGLAFCNAVDASGSKRRIVLKPGGFGTEDALVEAANKLRRANGPVGKSDGETQL